MDRFDNHETSRTARIATIAFWSVAIGLAIVRGWTMRFYMNPDGMSYLDMGDAFWRRDWSVALNAYWSPMYSWLTGLVLHVFHPSPYWEFAAVQVINFVVYVVVLFCFGFFWRETLRLQKARAAQWPDQGISVWPEWSWMLLGYSIAAWVGLRLITVEVTSPDMLLAGSVYLASGLIVRIRRGLVTWPNFALLGLVLGLGYLAKSPMFPLAFVFLGVAMFSAGDWKKGVSRALLGLLVFSLVAGPLVGALTLSRGHFTFGESGRVNLVMLYEEKGWWQGGAAGGSQKELPEAPLPVEIATVEGVTYLPFYDHTKLSPPATAGPSAAAPPSVPLGTKLARYVKIWLRNARVYYDIFVLRQGPLLAVVLLLFLMGPGWQATFRDALRSWHVLIPVLAALGAYELLIVELRYAGPFVPVFWGGILTGLRLGDSEESRRVTSIASVVVAVLFAVQLLGFIGRDIMNNPIGVEHSHWEVAQGLQQMGLQPGDKVGVMGRGQRAYWARIGRFSIAAEISPRGVHTFWSAAPESRKRSLEAFAKTGARAVVIQVEKERDLAPDSWQERAVAEGWHRLGNSDRYAYLLR